MEEKIKQLKRIIEAKIQQRFDLDLEIAILSDELTELKEITKEKLNGK